MIAGIGIDLQKVQEIEGILSRQGELFERKVFTGSEIEYCRKHKNPARHFAARWAVKEAFLKAMGTGITGRYRLLDVETVHLPSGQPHVHLHGKAEEDCWERNLSVHVSISHSGDYAVAHILLVASA